MKLFLSMIFCLGVIPLQSQELEGMYSMTGFDPYDQNHYTGIAVISKVTNEIYHAEWVQDSGESYRGTGLRDGDRLTFVFLSRHVAENIELVGVTDYEIKGDTLDGAWIYWNMTDIAPEKLVKQKK